MAVVPVCYKLPYKDHVFPLNSVRHQTTADGIYAPKRSAILNQGTFHFQNLILTQTSSLHRLWSIKGENLGMEVQTSKQLRLLDSYFGQLHGNGNKPSSESSDEAAASVIPDKSKEISTMEELKSLNSYLGKLNKGTKSENYELYNLEDQSEEQNSVSMYDDSTVKSFIKMGKENVNGSSSSSQTLDQNEETSDLYLIGVLVSINIAVFLFEIASPVRNSELGLFSVPLLYGAKINDLILVGEWWRLVTPMFLHSGVFHVGLGCWSLMTFGTQVCRSYGSFTFFLIYILGGLSGNLTSFLHTPQPTVGGTGPIFAIIGAWLVYQMQNKDVIGKEVVDSMYQKAIIITGLSFILSHFGPIDDWTHLGAVITGIVYGLLTCSSLQLDNASSSSSSSRAQEEGIALVRQYSNPCRSLAVFAVCVLFLSSLLVFMEPPLNTPQPDELDFLALLS
ncbi:RHOMBOID-like protein 9, chloroplastic [Euphorbia lathyris]|uniref:RHOMBOID-like protein 9, chloroplastic n=1 Tax=Euphorbia lathyris TaxID=212925 RepID=UPI00331378E2